MYRPRKMVVLFANEPRAERKPDRRVSVMMRPISDRSAAQLNLSPFARRSSPADLHRSHVRLGKLVCGTHSWRRQR